MLIVYCETCGRRIVDDEIKAGKVRQIDENQYLCSKCTTVQPPPSGPSNIQQTPSGKAPTLSIDDVDDGSKVRTRSGSKNKRISGGNEIPQRRISGGNEVPQKPPARSGVEKSPPAKSNPTAIYAGAAVGILVLVGLIALLGGGGSKSNTSTASTQAIDKTAPVKKERDGPAPTPPLQAPVVAPTPTPVVKPPPETPNTRTPPPAPKEELNFRDSLAEERLKIVQDWFSKNPKDPWGYSERLTDVTNTYRGTPAAKKAQDILASLTLPPKPAPVEVPLEGSGAWKAVFDGSNLDQLKPECLNAWKLENKAIVNIAGTNNAAQFRPDLQNVEVRFRFEFDSEVDYISFAILQGEGAVSVVFDRPTLAEVGIGKTHELVIAARGKDAKKATLNGKSHPVHASGDPKVGKIQIACKTGRFKIFSIDYRPLAEAPQK